MRVLRALAILVGLSTPTMAIGEDPDILNLEGMTWSVGYQFVAMKLCKINYDPERINQEIAWIADYQNVSVARVRRLAEKFAAQFEPNWRGKTSKNCLDARKQAERLGLLTTSKTSIYDAPPP
jgi:hypothetical protein